MEGDKEVEEGGGVDGLVGHRHCLQKNMRKRSRAEALPIFYWAQQLMMARLMKWREEVRVR